jgi:hypothetical protein
MVNYIDNALAELTGGEAVSTAQRPTAARQSTPTEFSGHNCRKTDSVESVSRWKYVPVIYYEQ